MELWYERATREAFLQILGESPEEVMRQNGFVRPTKLSQLVVTYERQPAILRDIVNLLDGDLGELNRKAKFIMWGWLKRHPQPLQGREKKAFHSLYFWCA